MNSSPSPTRRGLIRVAGAGALAGAFAGGLPGAAAADRPGPGSSSRRPQGAPPAGLAPIGSAPESGWSYLYRHWIDFHSENSGIGRAWGFSGVRCNTGTGGMWTTVDLPAGALVRDVEWYAVNSSGSPLSLIAHATFAGSPGFYQPVVDQTLDSADSSVRVLRAVTTSTTWGPFPVGTTLVLGCPNLSSDGKQQINGVRVGYSQRSSTVGLLASPVRAYDSRTGPGRLAANVARRITLPAALAGPGATGVLANLTVTGSTGTGFLKAWPVGAAEPSASVINWGAGQTIANAMPLGISDAREFWVKANTPTHLIVDVTGTVG